ncbi:hypothetical protein J1N35_011818 [Gossypium stocksii]|uniref:Uncharacterized protein n=1 Tax=Gossypium stocksii TaxID=47602 RepID=A0A9D3W4Q8_9ROSI|nr:hypothetical protein J1N35_011818 [Gossypium stocksii]
MENELAELSLGDGEEEILLLPNKFEFQKAVYNLCMVGCFLTASVVHFPVMRSTIANLWHPLRGVHISTLGEKRLQRLECYRAGMGSISKGEVKESYFDE